MQALLISVSSPCIFSGVSGGDTRCVSHGRLHQWQHRPEAALRHCRRCVAGTWHPAGNFALRGFAPRCSGAGLGRAEQRRGGEGAVATDLWRAASAVGNSATTDIHSAVGNSAATDIYSGFANPSRMSAHGRAALRATRRVL